MEVYNLLKSYYKESKILSKAYSLSEQYYRNMFKIFNYPVVVLSAVNTVCLGVNVNQYITLSLSLSMFILLGFDKLIDPKDKEHESNKYSVEYGEISSNIKQFIMSNNRTKEEIKNYTEIIFSLITKWKSFNPPLKDKFIKIVRQQYTDKLRSHTNEVLPPRDSSMFNKNEMDVS